MERRVCERPLRAADSTMPEPLRMTQKTLYREHRQGCAVERVDGTETASQAHVTTQTRAWVPGSEAATKDVPARDPFCNLPVTVKEAARFLGVSPQTVYLWVERRQIPHFRVMGRNIRFLKSDLKPFRAQFKKEVENGKTA